MQHNGERVFDFEKFWKSACGAVGVEGALFHDLRRTAVTNMIEAGFSEKEGMEISGHKTRSVCDRYHIVSTQRIQQLGERLNKYLKTLENESLVQAAGATQNWTT